MGNAVPQNVVARCNRCKGVRGGGNSMSFALVVVVLDDDVEATEEAYTGMKEEEEVSRWWVPDLWVEAVKAAVVLERKTESTTRTRNTSIRQSSNDDMFVGKIQEVRRE